MAIKNELLEKEMAKIQNMIDGVYVHGKRHSTLTTSLPPDEATITDTVGYIRQLIEKLIASKDVEMANVESLNQNINQSVLEVNSELRRAIDKHGYFNNNHEAYGVLSEEIYEVLKALHENDDAEMYKELTQVAAVACKSMIMLQSKFNWDGFNWGDKVPDNVVEVKIPDFPNDLEINVKPGASVPKPICEDCGEAWPCETVVRKQIIELGFGGFLKYNHKTKPL